jgi:CDP-diacylglycerol--glycerol-3-phosphate 3-phosphatidyltransferase
VPGLEQQAAKPAGNCATGIARQELRDGGLSHEGRKRLHYPVFREQDGQIGLMDTVKDRVWRRMLNVPNVLTLARLVLSIVVFVLVPLGHYFSALLVFIVAASTDWVDGYWARRFNQVTQLGRIFDPFVDKIIVCGLFVFLAAEEGSGITAWMAVVVVAREMLVTALRGFIEQSGGDFSAKMAGKLKMVFQCVAGGFGLGALMYANGTAPGWLVTILPPAWFLQVLLPVSVWLAVLSTIYSGLQYVVVAAKHIVGEPTDATPS